MTSFFSSWFSSTRSQKSQFTPNDIAEYYDEWTPKYLEVFGDTLQAYRTKELKSTHQYMLERAGLKDGQKVLDAGCGVCGPSIYFARSLDIHIQAITVSNVQVTQAKESIQREGLSEKIKVSQADYHQMDRLFPANHFDVILFLESFSHASDPGKLLKAAYRVLKPGGTLYIKDYFRNTALSGEEKRKMESVVAKVDATFRCNTPTFDLLITDIEKLGFQRRFVDQVQYETDNSVWDEFDQRHDFNLYDRVNYCMWVMWGELCYIKPN